MHQRQRIFVNCVYAFLLKLTSAVLLPGARAVPSSQPRGAESRVVRCKVIREALLHVGALGLPPLVERRALALCWCGCGQDS